MPTLNICKLIVDIVCEVTAESNSALMVASKRITKKTECRTVAVHKSHNRKRRYVTKKKRRYIMNPVLDPTVPKLNICQVIVYIVCEVTVESHSALSVAPAGFPKKQSVEQ